MLSVTRLLCGTPAPGDPLRCGETAGRRKDLPVPQAHYKPVVVWSATRRCNLFCAHCYTASNEHAATDELTTREAGKGRSAFPSPSQGDIGFQLP